MGNINFTHTYMEPLIFFYGNSTRTRDLTARDINCLVFDWDSDWFFRISMDLFGFWLGFQLTGHGIIAHFRKVGIHNVLAGPTWRGWEAAECQQHHPLAATDRWFGGWHLWVRLAAWPVGLMPIVQMFKTILIKDIHGQKGVVWEL